MIQVLSCGAGTQSSVLLLMSCRGDLPKLDAAVFADTGWEPAAVYAHLEWLRGEAATAGIPLVTVKAGDLRGESLKFHTADGKWGGRNTEGRAASMPLFVDNWNGSPVAPPMPPGEVPWHYVGDDEHGDPIHEGWKPPAHYGRIRRQCTSEYKIEPIETYLRREVLGLRKGQRAPRKAVIDQWRGITVDEPWRLKDGREPWFRVVYPFVGRPDEAEAKTSPCPMTRGDCIAWFARHYPGRTLPRSACLGCPFHSNAEWRHIRDTDPVGWADAVAFDRELRARGQGVVRGTMYLHRSCVPLDTVPLDRPAEADLWGEECEGMCGV